MSSRRKENSLQLYQLILGQLRDDGFERAAMFVSQESGIPQPSLEEVPENRLSTILEMAMSADDDEDGESLQNLLLPKIDTVAKPSAPADPSEITGLDFDDPKHTQHRTTPTWVTRFITTHKNGCRVAKFSPDGTLVATGSQDTSIKLLDVTKMRVFNSQKNDNMEVAPLRPVIRTFYDHTQSINDLDFHPFSPMLISCSRDCTIKFYDYKSSVKRAKQFIQDTHNVRSINFHPSGDFVVAGTDHHMIRLYDCNTLQAYTASDPKDHHFKPINQVRYSPDGSVFASCSKDGYIKIWDAINNRVVRFFASAHGGNEVSSVQFSRNNKYLLSSGKDSTIRLWDLATGRTLKSYTGGVSSKNRLQACFNYNEDMIFGSDEKANSALVWDSRSGELRQRLTGHNNLVRWIASSPVDNAIMTCSDDHRARYWTA